MTDTFPAAPPPDSGEEQYRQWVEQMKTDLRTSRMQSPQAPHQTSVLSAPETQHDDSPGDLIERSVLPRPVVTVTHPSIDVAPGSPVRVKVVLRNVGPVVETYNLSVVGAGREWISLIPTEVSLFPGDEGATAAVVKPPRSPRVPAGDYHVGIMARSEVDQNESAVAPLLVSVAPYYDASVSLSRTTLDMRRRTSTYVQITNNGNTRVRFRLDLSDPDGYLRFRVEEPSFSLDPGETIWKKVLIRGPLHVFGRQRTLSMLAVLVSEVDETYNQRLEDVTTPVQRVTLIQRPLIRLRLGGFGRLLLILALIGAVAAFVLSRLGLSGTKDVVSGPPATPPHLTAEAYGTSEVLLKWDPVPGTTGYSIYAVGDTGNALASNDTPSPASQAAGFGHALVIVPAMVKSGGDAPSTRPSPSQGSNEESTAPSDGGGTSTPSPTSGTNITELRIESPSCGDCTHVADVPSGSTRYVVTKTMPGQDNCYRIVAVDGQHSSLYTPMECAYVLSAAEADAAAAAGSDSESEGSSDPLPCPPYLPQAEKLGPTALAVTWLDPFENKPARKATGCSRKVEITGFEVQRQILSGWSTVSPPPGPSDTALEISDLDPATRYCFRMRSTASSGESEYSETFCGKTAKVPPSPEPTDAGSSTDAETGVTGTDAGAMDGFVFEPQLIEPQL